jgi:membrane associated rhomboid family serine protease
MAKPNPFEGVRSFVVKGGMPITMTTIGVSVVAFIAWWLSRMSPSWIALMFDTDAWLTRPWTVVTYALAQPDPVGLLFSGLMAFYFMGAMERAWERGRFLAAYFALLVAPPLAVLIGALFSGEPLLAYGLSLTTACWLVAFATYRPEATIMLMGCVPIKAKWLGWLSAIGIVVSYGYGAPVAGLGAGLAPLVAWGLATKRVSLPLPKKKEEPFADEFRKSMKTKRDAESERLRLRKLLEGSIDEDDS